MTARPPLATCVVGVAVWLAVLGGCDRAAAPAGGASLPATAGPGPAAVPIPDTWTGRWLGPEGTFLDIQGSGGRYRLAIRDLDGERMFEGRADGPRIVFERNGNAESIRAGTGAETGMKWLAEQSTCLLVKSGEGWCR